MNQLYKRNEYIVFPVENSFIVCNTKKIFEDGHTHVTKITLARLLIDLAIERKLPKNPHLVDNLIRISNDSKYIELLQELKETIVTDRDFEECMRHDSFKRIRGALRSR